MPEDKGDLLASAEVGEPVPGKDALHRHHEIVPVRRDDAEKRFGARAHVSVDDHGAALVQDADIHRAGVQVDSARVTMLSCVESHRGLLLKKVNWGPEHTKRYAQEGASMSIIAVEQTAGSHALAAAAHRESPLGRQRTRFW